MKHILNVDSVTKSYIKRKSAFKFYKSRTLALDNVTFNVAPGDIIGVIGHNGAGKTTLFKILAGLLDNEAGEVNFGDQTRDVPDFNQREIIGYVPSDERSFFWQLTGKQNLRFFGGMYGLSKEQVDLQISENMRLLKLDVDKLFRDYSAGMRKKVAVLRAFLHKPDILIMDEVTNSLDPDSCDQVKKLVKNYIRMNSPRAVLWSTHRMDEVSEICDKVLLLNKGKVHFFGDLDKYQKTCCPQSSYLIRAKAEIADYHGFKKKIGEHINIEKSYENQYTDYVLKAIDQDSFGKVLHIAVKEYDAHIVFAGCVDKEVQ